MHIIPFLRGEPVLLCDIDNVAYRTFLDASASGSRIVDHLSIEIHGGRSATIEIVSFTATEILHDPGKLVEGKTITFGSSAVSKTGKIKGVKKGTATITVKSGKASVKVQVTVR